MNAIRFLSVISRPCSIYPLSIDSERVVPDSQSGQDTEDLLIPVNTLPDPAPRHGLASRAHSRWRGIALRDQRRVAGHPLCHRGDVHESLSQPEACRKVEANPGTAKHQRWQVDAQLRTASSSETGGSAI